MPKYSLLFAICLFLGSCKEEPEEQQYRCSCIFSYGGSQQSESETITGTFSEAEEECSNKEAEINAGPVASDAHCELHEL